MKASSELALSFNEHQEIAGGIQQAATDFELLQFQPTAMSGKASNITLDPSRLPSFLDGYLDGKMKFNYDFRLRPDFAPEASLEILDVDPRRSWRMMLNGDSETWNLLNANTGRVNDTVPHALVIIMLGSSARIDNRLLSGISEHDDTSIVQTLANALPLSQEARSYSAQRNYISRDIISPITASLLVTKQNRKTSMALLLEDSLDIDLDIAAKSTPDTISNAALRQYIYMFTRQHNQMRDCKAYISIEDPVLPSSRLKNLARNDQYYGNDAAERFRKALTMLRDGSLPDFLAAS